MWAYVLIFLAGMCLSGCSTTMGSFVEYSEKPYTESSRTGDLLRGIPDLDQEKITIAIYDFPDRTGQRKPNTKFSQLSTAVTQGPEAYLIDALKKVSGGDWFIVVERKGLQNLVRERQLVRSTRLEYDGDSPNILGLV